MRRSMDDMYLLYVLKKVVYTLNSPCALKKTTKKKGDKYITGTCLSVDKEKVNRQTTHQCGLGRSCSKIHTWSRRFQ